MSDAGDEEDEQADLRDRVRADFVRERGFWAAPFEAILRVDPEFLAAYAEFSAVPWRRGQLEPKVRELIYIAADASVTHLHEQGTAAHIRSALRHGATRAEIAAVLGLTSLLGLQTLELGISALAAESVGNPDPASVQGWLTELTGIEPEAGRAVAAWRDAVQTASPLEPKVAELIGVAINAATTHLNLEATRQHIRSALALGATRAEIAEVLMLVAVLGIHTATMAMPVLLEELGESFTVPEA